MTGEPYTLSSAMGAITVYYEEARNFDTVDLWVVSGIQNLLAEATGKANTQLATEFLQNGAGVSNGGGTAGTVNVTALTMGSSSGALVQPFSWNLHNLRPFDTVSSLVACFPSSLSLLTLS